MVSISEVCFRREQPAPYICVTSRASNHRRSRCTDPSVPTAHRAAVTKEWNLPRPKKCPPDTFLNGLSIPVRHKKIPMQKHRDFFMVTRTEIDLRSHACADILDLFPLTATRAAIRNKWNLPRPKKCPPDTFLNGLSIPVRHKKIPMQKHRDFFMVKPQTQCPNFGP